MDTVKNNQFGWIVSAVGLTGALVALGYTVRLAQGDLLGVATYDPERAGYILAAGDFIAQTLLLLLSWFALAGVCVMMLAVAGFEVLCRRVPSMAIARPYLALGIAAVCVFQMVFFVLPTKPIRAALVDDICVDRYFEVSRLIQWKTRATWKDIICSRTSKETVLACGGRAPGEYRADLQHTFVVSVLLVAVLWVLGWRVFLLDAAEGGQQSSTATFIPWEWAQALLLAALLLSVFGLAYQYGKTVESTQFRFVKLVSEEGTLGGASRGCQDRDKPVSVAGSGSAATPSFFAIAENDQSSVLYDATNDLILSAKGSVIQVEVTSSLRDVLGERIARKASSCKEVTQ